MRGVNGWESSFHSHVQSRKKAEIKNFVFKWQMFEFWSEVKWVCQLKNIVIHDCLQVLARATVKEKSRKFACVFFENVEAPLLHFLIIYKVSSSADSLSLNSAFTEY